MKPYHSNKASVLITALIFMAVIALSLGSYFQLTQAVFASSIRNYHYNSAGNLVEYGLDSAMLELNNQAAGNPAWANWNTTELHSTPSRSKHFQLILSDAKALIEVCVLNYASTPVILSKATVNYSNKTVVRYGIITTKTRSLFAYGLLTKNILTASGGAWFDSWISDPDNNDATPAIRYSASVARDNAKIATISTATPAISLGSADLYGSVAVGAATNAGLSVSWGGQVGPRGMPLSGSYNVAPGAITTNFTASFEPIQTPTDTVTVAPYQLPYNHNKQVSNQWSTWYENVYIDAETIGAPNTTTKLLMNSFRLNGNATLTIKGNVVLVITGMGNNTFDISGSGKLKLDTGATLSVYTAGDVSITGAGVLNQGAPKNFQLWGTYTGGGSQKIDITGSGEFYGIIYAPKAQLRVPGGANLYGGAIVDNATFNGSGAFHYDESLINLGSGSGSVGIASYSEMSTQAEKEQYSKFFTASAQAINSQ